MDIASCYRRVLLSALFLMTGSLFAQVKVWEEDLVIPTWEIGTPEVNPTFAWSSNRQPVYPYPYREILTDNKVDRTYRACWLENEFIKVLVLPEIGGRLHGARDKTNGYNFFYWQPTIKPALVGMTGAWISGGIEWNFPHGHRPTGFSPVSYRLEEHPDGSKTVWVGETEWVYRMRWIVGLTVHPGKSVIEAKIRLLNSTPLRHSFQMWTTTATNANEDYQVIFPTRIMTGHGKAEFFNWPIHEGVDISWWKNVPNAASYFAEEPGGFFGGYDHEKNAGTVITGDPWIMVGKKFWTWGTSPAGRIWEPILTEGEGPYVEPQAGAYSDNQPDYHWIAPGEIKSFEHYFFPVRDIGPFKQANVHGALSFEIEGDTVRFGAYSAAVVEAADIALKVDGQTVFRETVDLNPAAPLVRSVQVENASRREENFVLTFTDSAGRELLRHSPRQLEMADLPEPATPYADPAEIGTLDELWHAGDITTKFRDPARGRAYFEEALRRDPGNSRARISLAELEIKAARYGSALGHLSVAESRDPDNGKLFYLRGVALQNLGDYTSAYDAFYRSVHFEAYLSRGYERVALLDLRKGDTDSAALHAGKALETNTLNPRLWALKATALRSASDFKGAEQAARKALELDPLDPWAARELWTSLKASKQDFKMAGETLRHLLGGDPQLGIETSLLYRNAGLLEDAVDLLSSVADHPIVSYYQAWYAGSLGDEAKAAEWARRASQAPVDNVFAFRRETIDVLQAALARNPEDGRAHYYLGLVHAGLADVARSRFHWETATRLDPSNPRAWRNLGLSFLSTGEGAHKALECYEQAFQLAPADSRILLELDRAREAAGVDQSERLAFLNENRGVVETRDALLASLVELLIEHGEHREALSYLESNHFNSWEGGYAIHNAYMEANIGLAEASSDPAEALRHYQNASRYPENLEVAPREPNLRGFLYYPMAKLHRQLGQHDQAEELLKMTAAEASEYPTVADFYRALALRDLGREAEAVEVLSRLETEARAMLDGNSEAYSRMEDDERNALSRYYLAKVFEAKGEPEPARQNPEAANHLAPGIERRAIMLAQRVYARAHQ